MASVRKKRKFSGIVFVPPAGARNDPEPAARDDLRYVCALDARPSPSELALLRRYHGMDVRAPRAVSGAFFLLGGTDVTRDVMEIIFEKYRVSGDLRRRIFLSLDREGE